jgi:hypothetical protein
LGELSESDLGEITAAYTWAAELVKQHKPLIVGVRFDPSWFSEARATFFTDRPMFNSLGTISDSWRREMYVGSYDPRKVYLRHGDELPSIRDIPSDAIVSLIELQWNSSLNSLLDLVWDRHA